MKTSSASFVFALLALIATHCQAAVNVGDKPTLDFIAADGTRVTLAALKGKILIVDFWATWCGPCMAEADHMVRLHKTHKDQGVQMIGISLDSNKAKMLQVARDAGFDWPHHFDGKVWQNEIARQWGVNSIPRTFLISPEGQVLWTGHSARIDEPLAKALKEHPPRFVDPKVAAQSQQLLERAQAALQTNDLAAALKLFAEIEGEARKDKNLAAQIDQASKLVEQASSAMLADVDAMIERKDYASASTRLRELSQIAGTPLARQAQDRLRTLSADPQVKAAIDAAAKTQRESEKGRRADDALATALKLREENKHDQAYTAFKGIIALYGGTPAALQSAQEVARYEQDPEFVKRMAEKAGEAKARSLLSMASSYRAAGKNDLARERYQQLLKEHPNTTFAAEAKKELDKLPK